MFLAEFKLSDRDRAGRILALSLGMAGIAGSLMTVAFILLAPMLAAKGFASPGLTNTLVASSGLLLLGVFEAVQTGALIGMESFQRVARLSCWNGLLSVPVIGILAYRYGAQGAIAGLTLAVSLSCLLNWMALRAECRHYGIRPLFKGCLSERRILFSFSLPSYISGLLVSPATLVASAFLVKQADGFTEMALFSAADRFRFLLIFLPLSASRISIPALSRYQASGDDANFKGVFRWSLWFGLALTVVPALVCVALSPILMSWYGPSFRRGWVTLSIVAISAIPTVFNTQLGYALVSTNRVWHRTFADVVLTVVFLGCAWSAVPRWGSAGLAGAFAVAYTAACLTMGIWLRKDHATR
ncbi:MAG: polysaccharide biosynthesis C-terminal domain-containing protein, partial [Acidobacteriota bacterium]